MDFNIDIITNKFIDNICPFCLGVGKLKAMQSTTIYNGSIRGKDKKVKCRYCNGTGIKE
ncbi:hypothetical protein [Clostridium perfringens]|jgi:hypothetical protein|uniref:Molecular chaperone DnaJ n=1 Tax=Clostridium perfringens TaxID=1502 RepID=A0AAW4IY29_CLOPF|nr:hypothetical protein [Clostridium perfringens]MBO3356146.1 hypothetical protein [Clostridium perfringens]MBO3359513.1 hypothetical protein [Clostridium perfringens]